jgi:hypothetical protein
VWDDVAVISRLHHYHAALIDVDGAIEPTRLREIAAAFERQANEHFAPKWGVTATVTAETQPGQHPLRIEIYSDEHVPGGFHLGREDGEPWRPYAVVDRVSSREEREWTRIASHELLEMLADPWGNRHIQGPSPEPGGGTVEYLVEVGDPCNYESYELDGVCVSDFVLPHYYQGDAPGPYSHTGRVKAPHGVLEGGYVTFLNPPDYTTWYWKIFPRGAAGPKIKRCPAADTLPSLREAIDTVARSHVGLQGYTIDQSRRGGVMADDPLIEYVAKLISAVQDRLEASRDKTYAMADRSRTKAAKTGPLIHFLISVSEDAEHSLQWRNDRFGTIRDSGLSDEHKGILMRNRLDELANAVYAENENARIQSYVTVSHVTVSLFED